jgi:ankyrin repeat protein
MIDKFDLQSVHLALTQSRSFECNRLAESAIARGVNNEIFSKIIASGADASDRVLLTQAVEASDSRFLRILLAFGASINKKSTQDTSPLLLRGAATVSTLELLIAQPGIDVNALDRFKQTPLHYFVTLQKNKPLRARAVPLLIAAGADLARKDDKGRTALQLTFTIDDELTGVIANALIAAGSDVNATDECGVSVLAQMLSKIDSLALLQFLISSGANVNTADREGKTPLHSACACRVDRQFRADAVALLLAAGANVGAKNNKGQTPLHVALTYDDVSTGVVISSLIAAGGDVNAADNTGTTVLEQCLTSKNNCLGDMRILIDAGADVRQPTASGGSLCAGAVRHSARLLEMLLAAGADVNAADRNGNTVCHAFANGFAKLEIAFDTFALLARAGANLDVANKHGETMLSILLRESKFKAKGLFLILDAGANVNSPTPCGRTAMHGAALNGNLTALELLMTKYGADINHAATNGETPLMVAAENGRERVAVALLAAGAKHDGVRVDDGVTALHLAIGFPKPTIANALIDAGANVNACDKLGWTPCHWACAIGDEQLVARMIDVGADVRIAAANGDTMLHTAALSRAGGAIIRRLLAAGADYNVANQKGQTVFHVAAVNLFALAALGGVGAVFDCEDKNGCTPLARAAIAGNDECIIAMATAGGDINRVNGGGSTLLHLHVSRDRNTNWSAPCIRTLVRLGVNVNALDSNKNSAATLSSNKDLFLRTLFAIGAQPTADEMQGWNSNALVLFLANTEDGSKIQSVSSARALLVAMSTEPTERESSEVRHERNRLATARLRVVCTRAAEVCIGLHSLRLAALELCEILLAACAPASTHVPFHTLWNIAVKVKHFKSDSF